MPVSAATSRNTAQLRSTSTPLLREGSRGPSVSRLQHLLRARGYQVSTDGKFGRDTADAVKKLQAHAGLAVDGEVGRKTWEALGTRAGAQPDAPASPAASTFEGGRGSGGTRHATGYVAGRAVSVALSPVGGGQYMNVRAAPAFRAMMDAARRDGVSLGVNYGFRTMAQQQHLYALYRSGRGNKAARPGWSNHQMGLSADISGTGGYGGRGYKWLQRHAAQYGFVNDVRGEPWHWTYKR